MADVQIDATIFDPVSAAANLPNRSIAWTTKDIGYVFVINSDSDLDYYKTTDGGATWSGPTDVRTGSVRCVDIWADWWTPGDTGTKIHLTYNDSTSDDVYYRYLQTSDDSLGTETTVLNGTSIVSSPTPSSITKARGGNLYIADVENSTRIFYRSVDAGANWTSRTDWGTTVAAMVLFPGNESDNQDVWALTFESGAKTFTIRSYDDSGNSWASATIFTSGESVLVGFTTGWPVIAGAIRHSDNHLIAVFATGFDSATADLKCYNINGTGSVSALTDVFSNADDWLSPVISIDQSNDDLYVGYIGKSDGSETQGSSVNVYFRKSTDDGSTWGSETAYSQGAAADNTDLYVDPGGSKSFRMGFVWYTDGGIATFNKVNSVEIIISSGATATIVSLLDELTAALNGQQSYLTTVDSDLDELTASLAAAQPFTSTIVSALDELQAALAVNQADLLTIGASVDELTASFSLNIVPLSVDVTITAVLDEFSASLEVVEHPQITLGASVDELLASLSAGQTDYVTIDADLDELTASLNVQQRYLTTIDADLDELLGSFNARQSHLVTVGATLDELTAALAAAQSYLLTVDADLDELTASLRAETPYRITIGSTLDEYTASLIAYLAASPNITAVLDELTASLNAAMLPKFTIGATLDELIYSGRLQLILYFAQTHIGGRVLAPPPHASIGGRVSRMQDARGRFRGPPPPAGGRRNTPG